MLLQQQHRREHVLRPACHLACDHPLGPCDHQNFGVGWWVSAFSYGPLAETHQEVNSMLRWFPGRVPGRSETDMGIFWSRSVKQCPKLLSYFKQHLYVTVYFNFRHSAFFSYETPNGLKKSMFRPERAQAISVMRGPWWWPSFWRPWRDRARACCRTGQRWKTGRLPLKHEKTWTNWWTNWLFEDFFVKPDVYLILNNHMLTDLETVFWTTNVWLERCPCTAKTFVGVTGGGTATWCGWFGIEDDWSDSPSWTAWLYCT